MASENEYLYMNEATIPVNLKCKLCAKPIVDPVAAPDERRGCRKCFIQNSYDSESLKTIKEKIVLEMLDGLLVKCRACGEINIRRGDLERHLNTECMLAIVSCTAADLKCPWQGAREKLSEHLDKCVFEPLRPAFGQIIEENKLLKDRINQLTISLNKLMKVMRIENT